MTTSIAIIGANGYAGATAAGLILGHPEARLVRATSRSEAGRRLGDVVPGLETDLEYFPDPDPGDAEVVIVALPHGMSASMAGPWLAEGRRVIDLGADFRLADAAAYATWYGQPHPDPDSLAMAVPGLPELTRARLSGASLVACPGCYATAAILALHPAAASGLARPDFIVDAASGVSGAGRSPSLGTQFSEVNEDFKAYSLTGHRHLPEIEQALGAGVRVTFVPHLVPMTRGILATCYFDLREGASVSELREAYHAAYSGCPFVEVVDQPPRTKAVAGSNRCLIHVTTQGQRVVVLAALDNLLKGAAGQGVQSLNLVMGWPETAGLEGTMRWP
ncbi:MAG: N-acetyl-gamma-glutamyl-phosphate reductase [Candidatus Dormibacteria bacterium]